MSKPKQTNKRAPGRPKKAEAEKLEQFSVRLSPKLKFGLEMLARAQHRSLSQAVEWAVQMGLNSQEVGRNFETIADIVDQAWKHDVEPRRFLEVYRAAPALLNFEDAAACELVDRSHDLGQLEDEIRERRKAQSQAGGDTSELYAEVDRLYWELVWDRWSDIRAIAVDLTTRGKPLQFASLVRLLDLQPPARGSSLLDIYEAAASTRKGK